MYLRGYGSIEILNYCILARLIVIFVIYVV
jgi:hypothetical protein